MTPYIIIFSILGMGIIYCIIILIRNEKVFAERMRVLEIISNLNSEDIKNGKPWEWRYREREKTTYNEMVTKIWIPIKEFYKNKDYLK